MIGINTKLDASLLDASLNKFAQDVREKVLLSGVAAMAVVLYDEAKVKVPVKTGLLRDAIYRAYSPERSSDETKTYRISWNKKQAPHGHLIEFGTSRAPAHPFLRPAFDRIREAMDAGRTRMAERLREL